MQKKKRVPHNMSEQFEITKIYEFFLLFLFDLKKKKERKKYLINRDSETNKCFLFD